MSNICVPFMKDFRFNDEIKEFTIKYNATKDDLVDLSKFIEAYQDRRINIELEKPGVGIDAIPLLMKINPEIYLKISPLLYKDKIDELKEKNIKFFFDTPCLNWDSLASFVAMGVSDVYISGELGFSLDSIMGIYEYQNVKIRTIVNLSQSTDMFFVLDPIRTFFIRPEDLEFYALYIDTFEFYVDNDDVIKYETLYKIYLKDKRWFGNLAEIITNLQTPIDSRTLYPSFATFRINCGKRCIRGGSCDICNRFVDMANVLIEKKLILKEKEKENGA